MGTATQDPCLFCDLSEHKTLCESEGFVAVFDNFPANPGHILVIPKRHVVSYFDLSPEEMGEAARLLAEAQRLVAAQFGPDDYTIGINDGPAAGRSVHHLHIHLIPRFAGDVPDPRGGIRQCMPGWEPGLW